MIDLIDKIDIDNFDIANLSYSNPKVGDCIIPYPDVTHRGTEIPESFASNKLTAQIINETYTPPPPNEEILAFIDKRHQIELDFEEEKRRLTQLSQEGQLSSTEFDEQMLQARLTFEQNILNLGNEYASNNQNLPTDLPDTVKNNTENNILLYLTIAGIALLGILLLWGAMRTKRK